MKRLLLIGLLACFAAGAPWADTAVPPLVNYQGLLTDENGAAIPDGMKKLEFNLYDAPLAGNRVWGPQIFDDVPVVGGRFNVILGQWDAANPQRDLSSAFAGDARFLGIKVANGAELAPRQQILSAPYALHTVNATHADNATQAASAATLNGKAPTWYTPPGTIVA